MKMNFAKAAVALLALVAVHTVKAETATIDGITWTYTVTNGCAMLGDGKSSAISTNTIGSIIIPSRIGRYDVINILDKPIRINLVLITCSFVNCFQILFF